MFTMPDDIDISKDILMEQLIRETYECKDGAKPPMWERRPYSTYTQYLYVVPITTVSCLIFRIYHYKTHDHHVLNICMSKNNGERYLPIYIIEGTKVLDLVKTIEKYENSFKNQVLPS